VHAALGQNDMPRPLEPQGAWTMKKSQPVSLRAKTAVVKKRKKFTAETRPERDFLAALASAYAG